MAAVDRLNAQLVTLPELIPCLIEGIYPEFGYPDCGPEKYLALLEDEARQVKEKIEQAEESQRESLQWLLAMLVECATALHNAGVR